MIDTDEGFAPLLARRVREHPAGVFARYEGVPISFAALDRTANVLALWMRRIGLAPGDAVALMLPRIGLARTMELTLTGRMMEAAEAAAIGLINYLVPRPEDVMSKTREVAALMASKPVMAFRLNKQRFRQVTQEAFDEAFRNGGAIQAEAYASGEPQETMRRFFIERAARRKARGKA